MDIFDLLSNSGYIVVNKGLVKEIGLEEAILFGCLASKYKYWLDRNELSEDGYFYCTQQTFKDETSLSEKQQKNAMDNLERIGLIKTAYRGIPCAKYYKICVDTVSQILLNKNLQNGDTSISKIAKQESPKSPTNNIKETILNNNIKDRSLEEDVDTITGNTLKESTDNTGITACEKNNKVKEVKHKYGEYQHVMLTDKQLDTLKSEFPNNWESWIERVDEYCESTGKTYKNYLATIRTWSKKDWNKQQSRQSSTHSNYKPEERHYI